VIYVSCRFLEIRSNLSFAVQDPDSGPDYKEVHVKKSGMIALLITVLIASTQSVALAQSLQPVAPEKVGMSTSRLDRIRPVMEKYIAENSLCGGVGLIVRRGGIAYFETYGQQDKETGKPMRKDSIFRIYSMTKAVTGVAAMTLYEEGKFSLTDPVSKYLPEFAHMKVAVEKQNAAGKQVLAYTVPAEHEITILDLMRHTSGLNYAGPNDEKGEPAYRALGLNPGGGDNFPLSELIKRLSQAPLLREPGTAWDYGFSIDVLARLVEAVSGKPIDQVFAERIFKPLHMEDTGYFVPESKWDRLVTMYLPNPDGTIRPAPAAMLEPAKKNPVLMMGGAGLMSTAYDYARFIQMLLNDGQLDGVRILSPKTVELMRSDLLGDIPRIGNVLGTGYGFGLTFAVNRGPNKTATIGSKGEYNWGGAAGTVFWIDPSEKMVGVFMMQTLLGLGKGRDFERLAYQAIVDQEKDPER
jgi:CubicO group peptidase (beta-lactamase class C family)